MKTESGPPVCRKVDLAVATGADKTPGRGDGRGGKGVSKKRKIMGPSQGGKDGSSRKQEKRT